MKIEVTALAPISDGSEIMLTLSILGDGGKSERRKFLLFTEQYLELGLFRGAVIDEDTFEKIEELSKKCAAIRKGSDLLAYSSSSRVRLAQRLRSKGIDRESAEDAAAHLQRLGAINERADIERLIQSGLKKLWGKRRIYRELCAKGYERDIISDELSKIDEQTLVENCAALLEKKHRGCEATPEAQKKAVASLVRYGYTFSEIKQALLMIKK